MSATGWTPGPWHVTRCDNSLDDYDCCLVVEPVNQPGKDVAHTFLDNMGTAALPVDEQRANIRLCAAAPDLFHACREAAQVLWLVEQTGAGDLPGMATDTLALLRAALAKANGRQA